MSKALVLTFLFSVICLSACEEVTQDEDSPIERATEKVIHQIPEGDLEIISIEGCEYIVFKDGRGTQHGFGYMAHKGNCVNPIHCYISPNDSVPALQGEDR